ERADALADRRQHRVAFGQVGDEARILLAEADQGLALLLHPPDREAALAAVAPGGVDQWFEHAARLHMADPLEVLQQDPLLGVDLLRFVEVLQGTAAAGAEVGAARVHPVGRGLQHFEHAGLVEAALATGLLHAHALARERAGDEHRLAGVRVAVRPAGDAAAVVAQIGDVEFEGGLVDAGQIGNPTSRPWVGSTCRSADHGSALRLFLLPVSAGVLVPPAGAGAFDPLLGEHAADLALPFRVAV